MGFFCFWATNLFSPAHGAFDTCLGGLAGGHPRYDSISFLNGSKSLWWATSWGLCRVASDRGFVWRRQRLSRLLLCLLRDACLLGSGRHSCPIRRYKHPKPSLNQCSNSCIHLCHRLQSLAATRWAFYLCSNTCAEQFSSCIARSSCLALVLAWHAGSDPRNFPPEWVVDEVCASSAFPLLLRFSVQPKHSQHTAGLADVCCRMTGAKITVKLSKPPA